MSDLDRVLYWHGVAAKYDNYRGEPVQVSLENRKALLKTMGVDISSEENVTRAAYELDVAPWNHWFPPLIVTSGQRNVIFFINLTPGDLALEFKWSLSGIEHQPSSGSFRPETCKEIGNYHYNEIRFTRREVPLPNLQPGYYQLKVTQGKRSASTTIAVTPATSYQPQWVGDQSKLWGFIVQLYTLRSERDWGIGDFSDLSQLIQFAADAGADVIGLNPLHTLLPDIKSYCSPYSPSDRRFINPLYIDIQIEPDYINSPVLIEWVMTDAVQELITTLRESSQVDYFQVKTLKYQLFEQMYRVFCKNELRQSTERAENFNAFVKEMGSSLEQHALYEVAKNTWPNCQFSKPVPEAVLKAGKGPEFDDLIAIHAEAINFFRYLQWLAHCQLDACQKKCQKLGMKLGIIRDLAVGADTNGSEVLLNQKLFCRGAAVGAPPDPLAEQGQNWGLPPMDPAELRRSGFAHFIHLLQTNMSRCGALRIDHAMSLMRLWWCPPGKTADYGAYVYYPFNEQLGLLKLESYLNHCVVVGEDLGVVPGDFRDAMKQAKIFNNKVFYFEKESFDRFRAPQHYQEHSLAMVNNHDVATLSSWWDGIDLAFRNEFDLLEEGVTYEKICENRRFEKQQVLNLLKDQQLLPESWQQQIIDKPADQKLIFAILKLNSRVNSQIFVMQLEDLMMMKEPVNIPGTFREYDNWKRKLTKTVAEVFKEPAIINLLAQINNTRKDKSDSE